MRRLVASVLSGETDSQHDSTCDNVVSTPEVAVSRSAVSARPVGSQLDGPYFDVARSGAANVGPLSRGVPSRGQERRTDTLSAHQPARPAGQHTARGRLLRVVSRFVFRRSES